MSKKIVGITIISLIMIESVNHRPKTFCIISNYYYFYYHHRRHHHYHHYIERLEDCETVKGLCSLQLTARVRKIDLLKYLRFYPPYPDSFLSSFCLLVSPLLIHRIQYTYIHASSLSLSLGLLYSRSLYSSVSFSYFSLRSIPFHPLKLCTRQHNVPCRIL